MVKKQSNKVDIVAVAMAAKVSPSTVSRSFNHPDLVNPATRKKIDRAVKKLGYIRNRAAQSMHGRRSGTIGLVVPTINHAIFAEVIQAFSDSIDQEGFTLLIASHGYDLAREYEMIRKLMEHRVDGLALIGLDHTQETFHLLDQQDVPTLAIWAHDGASPVPCVGADNMEAGRMAARHLVELGHRDIGLIFPATQANDRARHRKAGAMEVLGAAGITVPDHWQPEAPYSIAQAKQMTLDLLAKDKPPRAILCGNDVIAQGALFAAQKIGIRVPQDVSVMGIGDFKGSADTEPGLSTVRIPAGRIGRTAGRQFTNYITTGERSPFRIKCDLSLVPRGTTVSVIR